MNQRKKILTDRKLPDRSEIEQLADFDKVLNNYTLTKKLLLKNIISWSVAGITTASVITAAIIYFNSEDKTTIVTNDKIIQTQTAYINEPLKDIKIAYEENMVDGQKGGEISYPSGNSILVPADVFVFEDGTPVTGPVNLKFREFKNPKDIFLSGIPMGYDSAGTGYTLESAGMIELAGTANNKPVKLKAGKTLQVTIPSEFSEDNYNLYQLDTVKKNWVFNGRDSMQTKSTKQSNDFTYQPEQESALIKPRLADAVRYQCGLVIDKKQFPELAPYDSVKFEVIDNNFKPKFYKIHWDYASVKPGSTKGNYILSLKKADTTIVVNAVPVFKEKDYKAAVEQFQKRQNTVQKAVDQKNIKRDEAVASLVKKSPGITNRILVITQMGYWNSDRPLPKIPEALTLNFGNIMVDKNSKVVECKTIYVVQKNTNTVFTYPANGDMLVNTKTKNLVWTVSAKDQIVFIELGDYNSLYRGKKDKINIYIEENKELALAKIDKFNKGSKN